MVDMKEDRASSHSYMPRLEWKRRIPESFGVESLQLTEDVRAGMIHLTSWATPLAKTLGPQEETRTLVTIGAAVAGSAQDMGSLTPIQTQTGSLCAGSWI